MTSDQLVAELRGMLAAFSADLPTLGLRPRVLRLVDLLEANRSLGVSVLRDAGCDARGARERLRIYLVANVGVVLDAKELEVVGGISEYARRVRELREEDGYSIITEQSNDPDGDVRIAARQYLLLHGEPDPMSARRWSLAKRIRGEKGLSARDRILRFLQENVGQVVTCEEIRNVSMISDYGRRVRELRTEEGYLIATCFSGRPDLKPGLYVLESLEPRMAEHDRFIPEAVQRAVYRRDDNRCRACGWSRDDWDRRDPRNLELHHIEHHAAGGSNEEGNLVVLCSRCHDEVHAGTRDISAVATD